MDLDRLAVELRDRSDWEAVDLGFAMARAWRGAVYGPWLAVAAPVALVSTALAGPVGLLVFWWLLPLFETVVLDVVGRATFGTSPTARQVLRRVPGLWKKSLPEILWRRLHPNRSFRVPVVLLEGAAGTARTRRVKALESRRSDVPTWLTLSFFVFHVGLLMGLVMFVRWMTPSGLGIEWELFDTRSWNGELTALDYVVAVLGGLVLLAFDPIYVACGFALYLNRRVELEGWDLDLAFRRLDRRLEGLGLPRPEPGRSEEDRSEVDRSEEDRSGEDRSGDEETSKVGTALGLSGGLVVGLLGLLSVLAPTSSAEPSLDPALDGSRAKAAMAEVGALQELQTKEEVTRWQVRDDLELWRPKGSLDIDPGFTMPNLSFVFEILLWVGIGGLVVWMVREGLKLRSERSWTEHEWSVSSVLGLDIRRESLPDDVAAAAEDLWHQGRKTEALRLLYRAALSRLHDQGMELRESFTETDCLRRARALPGQERFDFFADLTGVWQAAAYAHRLPETDRARDLWRRWPAYFDGQEGVS